MTGVVGGHRHQQTFEAAEDVAGTSAITDLASQREAACRMSRDPHLLLCLSENRILSTRSDRGCLSRPLQIRQ
jgi:hypothetical protein